MQELSNETVVVTGASVGFGAAIARTLAAAGARLVLCARRFERLEALAKELDTPTHLIHLDVRDRDAVKKAFASLPAEFSEVTALVNNAGLAVGLEPGHQADVDDWERMIDTNVKGLLYCTRTLLPGMVERNRGYVINIGSVAGNWPYPGGHVYCGTKAFVQQFSLSLRADLLGTRVRVTNVEPGMATDTEFSLVRFKGDEARAASVYEGLQPLTGEDVAETVHWLLTRPPHVNVNTLELMPVAQAFSPLAVHRG